MDGVLALVVFSLVIVGTFAVGFGVAGWQRLSARLDDLTEQVRRLRGRLRELDEERAGRGTGAAPPPAVPVAAALVPDVPPSGVPEPADEYAPRSPPAPLAAPPLARDPVFANPVVANPGVANPLPAPREAPAPSIPWLEQPHPETADTFERFVGGRVLLVVGVIAVLFGLGFFLKLAIERGWVREETRVISGTVFGIAAIVFGDRVRARGLNVYGQALMGCGLGALFLCDWFASVRYGFYDRPAAFVLAGVVAATGAVLAVRRDAPLLAWLGFAGAWLAPALLGKNEDALEGLTIWLVVADLGLLVTLCLRRWEGLAVVASIVTTGYFATWHAEHFRAARLGTASACLAILVFVLLATALVPPIVARRRCGSAFAAVAIALVVSFVIAASLLVPDHRTQFGIATIVVAGLLAGASVLLRTRVPDGARDAESVLTYGLALVIAAVPVLFRGDAVAPAWATVGAASVVAGARTRRTWFVAGGVASIALATIRVLTEGALHAGPFTLCANGEFLSALTIPAALFVASWALRREDESSASAGDLAFAAGAFGLTALLTHEVWRWMSFGDAGLVKTIAARGTAVAVATTVCAVCAAVFAVLVGGKRGVASLAAWAPLGLAVVHGVFVLDWRSDADVPLFWNAYAGAGAAVAAAAFVAAARRVDPRWVGGTVGVVCLFVLLTFEWITWGRPGTVGIDGGVVDVALRERRFDAQVGLSVSWALYAAVLVGVGFRRDWAAVRWAGIALFLVTIAKVFLVDLDRLGTAWRVASFMGLGALLVGASYLYQRVRKAEVSAAPTSADAGATPPPD